MANVYFGQKLFIELLPIVSWIILFAVVLIVTIVRGIIENRKINYKELKRGFYYDGMERLAT